MCTAVRAEFDPMGFYAIYEKNSRGLHPIFMAAEAVLAGYREHKKTE